MTYDSLISELLDAFPSLQRKYDEERDYIGDLQHPCFEDLFVPYICEMCHRGDAAALQEIGAFCEKMALSELMVYNVLAVSVLEPIFFDERDLLVELKKYLGKQSLELLQEIEDYYTNPANAVSHETLLQACALMPIGIQRPIEIVTSVAQNGNYDVIEYLFGRCGVGVNEKAVGGETALMRASKLGMAEMAGFLLGYGADASIRDDEGKTAIDYARENEHEDIVRMLEGA